MPDRDQDHSSSKGPPVGAPSRATRRGTTGPASAFDVWLDRGLKTLFADVVEEPIPPELLKIIEQGGGKK